MKNRKTEITERSSKKILLSMIKSDFKNLKIELIPFDKKNKVESYIFSIRKDDDNQIKQNKIYNIFKCFLRNKNIEIVSLFNKSLLLEIIKNDFENWKIESLPFDNKIERYIFSKTIENYDL